MKLEDLQYTLKCSTGKIITISVLREEGRRPKFHESFKFNELNRQEIGEYFDWRMQWSYELSKVLTGGELVEILKHGLDTVYDN